MASQSVRWRCRVSVNVVFRSVHHGGCCCFLIETRWKVATGKHSTGECNILQQVRFKSTAPKRKGAFDFHSGL